MPYITDDWSSGLNTVFKHKALNEWGLFLLICIPISAMIIREMLKTDLSTGAGASAMIGYSVRWAVPFVFLAMAASSIQILFPGAFPAWWLRNRKYIGLCFAVGMAWQGLFIFIMSNVYRDYYFEDVYYFRDELEGSVGYIFLLAMVATSFRFTRRHLAQQQWKLIQKGGIYFLWAYAFSVYWWNLFYYENPEPIDYLFYSAGFFAFALRIAAWGKQRHKALIKSGIQTATPATKILGCAVIAAGLILSATGLYWQKWATTFLTTPHWSAELELWLPFWPLEPFIPLLIIALGTALYTHTQDQPTA